MNLRAASSAALPPPYTVRVILVVDDEDDVRRFVRRTLEWAGYQVEDAGDPQDALRVLENTGPDLLLTDIVMPGLDGLKLAAKAHQSHPRLRAIFMTGFASQFEQELTGSVCLSKPFTVTALLSAVEAAIGLPRNKPAG